NLHVSSGPAIDHKGMLASLLTSLGEGDALFIDEIHRLAPVVEENLYPAMEDFRFDLFIGEGPHAKAVTMQLPRFTLLGATTRMGLLSAPLLDRFGFHWQLRYYELADMKAIVQRSAQLIGVPIDHDGASEIARHARRGRRAVPTASRLHRPHAARPRRDRIGLPAHRARRAEQGADRRHRPALAVLSTNKSVTASRSRETRRSLRPEARATAPSR